MFLPLREGMFTSLPAVNADASSSGHGVKDGRNPRAECYGRICLFLKNMKNMQNVRKQSLVSFIEISIEVNINDKRCDKTFILNFKLIYKYIHPPKCSSHT